VIDWVLNPADVSWKMREPPAIVKRTGWSPRRKMRVFFVVVTVKSFQVRDILGAACRNHLVDLVTWHPSITAHLTSLTGMCIGDDQRSSEF
jgi:hypothetical protein